MQVLLKPALGCSVGTLVSSVFPTPPQGRVRMLLCLQREKRKIVWVRDLEDGKKEHYPLKNGEEQDEPKLLVE